MKRESFPFCDVDFAVQDVDAAFAPSGSLFEFGEESTCVHHALCLEQQVIALVRVIAQDVQGVLVVVHQELCQELRRKRGGGGEEQELSRLVL